MPERKVLMHPIFLMGNDLFRRSNLTEENKLHGDILQGDFMEGHYNLTLKDHFYLKFIKGSVSIVL